MLKPKADVRKWEMTYHRHGDLSGKRQQISRLDHPLVDAAMFVHDGVIQGYAFTSLTLKLAL